MQPVCLTVASYSYVCTVIQLLFSRFEFLSNVVLVASAVLNMYIYIYIYMCIYSLIYLTHCL